MSMKGSSGSVLAVVVVAFLAGAAGGWTIAPRGQHSQADSEPARWVARIDDTYISDSDFIEEMQRLAGQRPGQFQDIEQRRMLLDDLVYRTALVKAADKAGLTEQPELRRTLDQLISNRYLQDTLREAQRELSVTDNDVQDYYKKRADEYVVPARKRIAMLKIAVPADAGEPVWKAAMARMQQARDEATALDLSVPHFGSIARDVSDDAASRYRGGVIGWIAEGRTDRYTYDRAVIDAARALEKPGAVSDVLRGEGGVYLVRLVESEPRQTRGLDQLASGIRQRILQDRLAEAEHRFKQQLMREIGVEVRESVLASITPLTPAAPHAIDLSPQPPAMPKDQG